MYIVYIFGAFVILVFLWFLLPFAIRKIEEKKIVSYCKKHGLIVMTFDDGPSENATSDILDQLKKYDIKASFFAVGKRLDKHESVLKRITDEGHDLGHHSQNHHNAWKVLPFKALSDIKKGQKSISSHGGNSKLFRPPFGKTTLLTTAYLRIQNISPCWWTVDPKDSLKDALLHDTVLELIKKGNGGVILLHDSHHYPMKDHDKYISALIDKIWLLAREREIKFIKYSELLVQLNN